MKQNKLILRVGKYRIDRKFLPEGATEISVPDTAEFTFKQIKARANIK